MLRITIELLPKGDEGRKQHLGTAIISNDLTGNEDYGNYRIKLSKWGKPNSVWKKGSVKSFPRKTRGPWDLMYEALKNTVGRRSRKR